MLQRIELYRIKNIVTFDQRQSQIIKNSGTTHGKLDIAINNLTIGDPTEAAQMAVWINKNEMEFLIKVLISH